MHPILFSIGNFPIYTYGLTMALAFVISFGWVFWEVQKSGENIDDYYNVCLIALICGILGARLVFIFVNLDVFIADPMSAINLRTGGMVWYGGLFAVFVAIYIYTKRKNLDFLHIVDVMAAPTMLGLGIGRLGCLMSGCCYGTVCTLPWGIVYPDYAPLPHELMGMKLHPSPIYEMIACFAIAGFLAYFKKKNPPNGQIVTSMILLYAVARFLLEIWRGDTARGYLIPNFISVSQGISIVAALFAAVVMLRLKKSNGEKSH